MFIDPPSVVVLGSQRLRMWKNCQLGFAPAWVVCSDEKKEELMWNLRSLQICRTKKIKFSLLSLPLPWQGQERKSVKRSGILAKEGSIKQTRYCCYFSFVGVMWPGMTPLSKMVWEDWRKYELSSSMSQHSIKCKILSFSQILLLRSFLCCCEGKNISKAGLGWKGIVEHFHPGQLFGASAEGTNNVHESCTTLNF